jgi:diguanylate cyclase (GGDEF)-like protein
VEGSRSPSRQLTLLIVDDRVWSARSLESALGPNGFAIVRAFTAKDALDRVRRERIDAILISAHLHVGDVLALCRTLRGEPFAGHRLPIVITSSERPSTQQRLDAFGVGAWDYIGYPQGAEELVLKLEVFIGAKREADHLEATGLIDELTGLYNLPGVQLRGEELDSMAYRRHDALACLVFAALTNGNGEWAEAAPERLKAIARAFRGTARRSDIIGRTESNEFVVLAPGTDAGGATRLAERISTAAVASEEVAGLLPLELRAGLDAVANARETPRKSTDLLSCASVALANAKADPAGHWLKPFERPPVS